MQIIELSGTENITVIRDLLEHATESEVLLYVPQGSEALERNEVNLRVLRRWADNLALRVGLAIEDSETRVLAREASFVVFSSLEEGQKANLDFLDRKRRRRRWLPPRPSLGPLWSHESRVTSYAHRHSPLGTRYLLLTVAVLLGLALLVLLFALPSATVTLKPVSEPVEAAMEMTGIAGLGDVNYGQAQVPARIVSVEREGNDTIATTDKRDVPDGHAEGSVVFANKTSVPVTITKGTVVRTSFGETVRFYTVADVWLPGELHRTVRVGILAAEPGPRGNVPALTINVVEGELSAQVDVLNDARTTGGTVRRMSIVGGDDKVRLRAKLMKRLQEEAYAQLITALRPGEFVPPESLAVEVKEEEFDHNIGDMVDTLGMKMKVKVTGLAVSGADGEQLLLRLLEQRMKPGYRLVDNSARFARGNVIEATQEKARFAMSVRASIAPAIETVSVQRAIAGKSVKEAKAALMQLFKLAAEPKIELGSSLLGRLPWWAARIHVRVTSDAIRSAPPMAVRPALTGLFVPPRGNNSCASWL
jgi:hypothetical protein